MALNPDYFEQLLLANARERQTLSLSSRERLAETIVGGAYVVAAAVILLVWPPELGAVNLLTVVACLTVLIVATRTEFDTGAGITVPTQLAFVPLLFALPPALVTVGVPMAWALAKLPEVLRGEMRFARLFAVLANSWFVVGPVVVLELAGVSSVHDATAAVLIVALAAQFGGDFLASAVRERLSRGASLREQLDELWVYAVDAALAPVGLLAVLAMDEVPWSAVAMIPLIGVLAVFARERRRRIENLSELNSAYRGMALVLGMSSNTTTATRASTAATWSSSRSRPGRDSAWGPTGCAISSSPPFCTMWARSRSPRRSSTSPGALTPTSGR